MSESINTRLNAATIDRTSAANMQKLLSAMLDDITELRAAIVAITAKLDADGGVTDTDYASTCDPAALTTTS